MSPPTSLLHDPRGSLWNRWDLHFHTPSSFDYSGGAVTSQAIVDGLITSGVRVVAITDHHVMDVARIKELQKLGGDKLTVLPGIELRSDQGGSPIHYICIFPENCDLDHVWTTLQGKLGLTPAAVTEKGGDDKVYVPIEDGAAITRELGGVVSIHAGAKSNSIEGIKNQEEFQKRIKLDITDKWVDLMEIGQLKDIDVHLNKIFPSIGLTRALIICSDNHDIAKYSVKARLWFRADPTFRGLLMVMREPLGRVFIGDRPPEHIRLEQNPTKYIRGISFQRKPAAKGTDKWFNGKIQFNPGLVAIVGNKGSGKSALSDMLGLLGASKNPQSFSFLSKNRFRHPTGGHAGNFDATLEWNAGDPVTKCLADSALPEEVERLKYLPQDHVETVCNELSGFGQDNFEKELKSVIFSHVPDALRLSQTTLDDLVRFQSGEKQKRIDALVKQLREVNRSRAALEAQADPAAKREIQEKIIRRELELAALIGAKPPEKANPSAMANEPQVDANLLQSLTNAEDERRVIEEQIVATREALSVSERRLAVAKRLLEKLNNFEKEFNVFATSLRVDATELGVPPGDLATLNLKKEGIEAIRDAASADILRITAHLDENDPNGLAKKLAASQTKLTELQSNLDAPNRAYQVYLGELAQWQEKWKQIEGDETDAESLKGLHATFANLDNLPGEIFETQAEQKKLALEIHEQKLAMADVFRTLYKPVQQFIDSHTLAKDKLKLEFRAELTNQNFTAKLVDLIALNRRGSFMGADEGRAKSESFVQMVTWGDKDSVGQFLQSVDDALHNDQRENPPIPVQLRDQLPRNTKPEEVFDFVYGLGYVEPRYILRWEGKEISMLSPGERGTLLLVFYLLIDKGDMPLVIDQPEGNLDNHTVAKVLVDCIREARQRRQVFIVTHNPNLAVVCDADQIVHASMDKTSGNAITYASGALENPDMSKYVTDVLEGTRWAFGIRGEKYKVGD